MRRNLLVLSLTLLTLSAGTSDAFAQRRSGGGGRGASPSAGRASVGRASVSRGYNGGGGYAGRGYYGGGYGGGYYGGGYGGGYYGGGLGLGLLGGGYYGGYGYSPLYQGYSYAPSYYDSTPGYSNYSDPAIVAQAPQVRQSAYPAVQDFANVTVLLPTADAQVWFQNAATTQQGMQRLFNSPPLTPNEDFSYTIKARWMENGKTVNQVRQVHVQAGQNVTVNFRQNSAESLASPMPGQPIAIPQK